MSSLCLNKLEKQVVPSLRLHNSAEVLNSYQINLGKEIRSKKNLVKKEAKQKNETFKREFKKLTEPNPKYVRKLVGEKETTGCDLKKLGRILLCFEEPEFINRKIIISDICDFTLLLNNVVNDGLKFLVKYKIIIETKDERGNYFYKKCQSVQIV